MLIILEGPDGAGKTSAAHELVNQLTEAKLLHQGPPRVHPLIEYEVPLLEYQPGLDRHLICDRWHLGEVVYPLLLKRSTQLTPEALWHIEAYLLRQGAVLVHVDAPLATLEERLTRRGDDLITVDQLPILREAYDEAMRRTLVPNMVWTSAAAVLERAVEQETAYRALAPFPTYVGPRYPSLLLLGERRNQRRQPWSRSPAFMPFPNTAGYYLLACLTPQLLPVDRRRVGIANACDEDVAGLYAALGEPSQVVTLGALAESAVRQASIPYRAAPHPQWVRRFHHHEWAQYADLLLFGREPSWS